MRKIVEKLATKKETRQKREIIINAEQLETRVAFLVNGRLDNFFVEHPTEDRLVGSIFKGRIQNLEDGLQAAFIDIGMKKNAFIHYWDMVPEDMVRLEMEEGLSRSTKKRKRKKYQAGEMAKQFKVGQEILVQVTKDAIGTKGPRVSANLSIPGRYLVMMPQSKLKGVSRKIEDDKERERLKKILARLPVPDNIGFIIRTAGSGARKTAFARDLRVLIETWKDIEDGIKNAPAPARLYHEPDLIERVVRDSLTEEVDRILIDNRDEYERIRSLLSRISRWSKRHIKLYEGDAPILEYLDVERQIDNAFRRKVWLPGGGYLIFDETEALVAIDINTGRHKGGDSQEESITQVNLESAEEIARQLRLRNVGGLVVIDFIDMKQRKNRNAVYRRLREAMADDTARTNILPISDLGLLEMTRQRQEESIRSGAFTECPYCKGRGVVKSILSTSVDLQRHIMEVVRKHGKDGNMELSITVHPMLLDRLRREDEQILVDLETKHGAHMTFIAQPQLHTSEFIIADPHTKETYYNNVDKGTRVIL